MIKDREKVKKAVVFIAKVLGVAGWVFVAFYFITGKFLSFSSTEKMTAYQTAGSGYSGSQTYNESPSISVVPSVDQSYDKSAVTGGGSAFVATLRKVVKNGALEMLVSKAEDSVEKIKAVAVESDGFVDAVNVQNVSENSKFGTITIRVPADKFDGALTKIKTLAIKVDREQVTATDVTEEFVDLQAQLTNLKAQEAQYLKILGQADKIPDILSVSQNLSFVRGEIERLQGRIKYLSSQIDMSTITISLTEEADVKVFGIRWRPLFVLKQGFRDMLSNLSGYADSMISFVFILPVIVVWLLTLGLGLWLVIKIYRWVKNKFFSKK